MTGTIDNPILNSPHEQPDPYDKIGPCGPNGEVKDGRCPSEPIAAAKKGRECTDDTVQVACDCDSDATGQRRDKDSLINDVAYDVQVTGVTEVDEFRRRHRTRGFANGLWRSQTGSYPGADGPHERELADG